QKQHHPTTPKGCQAPAVPGPNSVPTPETITSPNHSNQLQTAGVLSQNQDTPQHHSLMFHP
uniref:hypothetical protein n=1 Tax=uncultured Micrococcus sp. TaxID=114051 RepID=UPI0026398AE8